MHNAHFAGLPQQNSSVPAGSVLPAPRESYPECKWPQSRTNELPVLVAAVQLDCIVPAI
jgi:hypothetical protein